MAGFTREKAYVLKRLIYYGSGNSSVSCSNVMYLLKETLLYGVNGIKGDGAEKAWEVLGSCDSISYGMDMVDRITNNTKIVSSTGNHSWIVLKQAEMGGTNKLQICIDWGNSTNNVSFKLSFSVGAGFTGGALNAAPTATDQVTVFNTTVLSSTSMVDSCGVNCLKSTDGKSTRIFLSVDGVLHTFGMWIIEDIVVESYIPSSVVVGAFPISLTGYSGTSNCYMNQGNGSCSGKITSAATSSLQMAEGSTWSMRPNANGEWQFYPCGFLLDTGADKGWVGRFQDLWIAPTVFPSREYFAADGGGDFQYVNISGLVQPWVGEPLILP